MSTFSPAHGPPSRPLLAAAAIAAGVTALVCLPFAPGPLGLLGLLLAAGAVVAGGLAVWVATPQVLLTLIPTLIPSPMFVFTYAWELALLTLAAGLLLFGWRERKSWLTALGPVERILLLFTLWALLTGFWSTDLKRYLTGVRLLVLGALSLWIALRLPNVASRRWFDLGVTGAAIALSFAAIRHTLSTGFSPMQALLHRSQVTDLGWGTANYVASLLLLCAPSVLRLVLRGGRIERVLAGGGFALVTAVQFIVASRAAVVLFLGGTLVQLLRVARRFRLWVALGFGATLTGLLLSPAGTSLIGRFYNLRDLGSMTIRIWYFREGWRRLLEHQPWGMGLGQGYANGDHLQGIDPHDYWLVLGGDLGVLGVALWVCVLVALVRAVWGLRDREQVHTLLVTMALANLHTLVEPTFQGPQYQMLFFWVVGGTLAFARAEEGVASREFVRRQPQYTPAGFGTAPPVQAPDER
jgi:hypothetical protein